MRIGSLSGNEAREPARDRTLVYLWNKGQFGEQLSLVESWLCDSQNDTRATSSWTESACRSWWRQAHGCPNGFGLACAHGVVLEQY